MDVISALRVQILW